MVLESDHCRMAVAAHGIRAQVRRAVGLSGLSHKVLKPAPPAYPFLATMILDPGILPGLGVGEPFWASSSAG